MLRRLTSHGEVGFTDLAEEFGVSEMTIRRDLETLEAVEGAEALILATEWKEFSNVDFADLKKRMHTPLIFDGRNLFDPKTMREFGFTYHAVGRAGTP